MSLHDPNNGKRMERRIRVPAAFAGVVIGYLMLVFPHWKRSWRREGTASMLFIAGSPGPTITPCQ